MATSFRPAEVLDLEFAVASRDRENGTTRVWLSGELDLAGVPLLEQELDLLARHGREVSVVDLTELLFIDAVGMHAVLAVGDRGSEDLPLPAMVGASRPVSKVFELVGLEHHIAEQR